MIMKIISHNSNLTLMIFIILLLPISILAECTCDLEPEDRNKPEALKYKLIAIGAILVASALGVSLPFLGQVVPAFRPENDMFFLIKAFAAGVILATGFVHVLPDAFESLTSPCLGGKATWGDFPLTGLVAMLSAMATLMVDTLATGYYKRVHFNKAQPFYTDEEKHQHDGDVHVHTHATHGHAHGSASFGSSDYLGSSDLVRHRIVSQVLELGIIVHSVIIGVSLGASESPKTIKPLVAALTFHQLFEGMGLGGCIAQAKIKARAMAMMAIFFSLTTPIGIAIGFGIAKTYSENSPTALIVEGIFNSASAGILVYMALVDLLAADFMNPRMQSNLKLQLGANLSLLLGSGFMSLLAIWA